MTLLIAGHETSAAVLTWTFYLLSQVFTMAIHCLNLFINQRDKSVYISRQYQQQITIQIYVNDAHICRERNTILILLHECSTMGSFRLVKHIASNLIQVSNSGLLLPLNERICLKSMGLCSDIHAKVIGLERSTLC